MASGLGDGAVPAGHGHLRTSTADRERAVDVLKAAFAEGRLDQDEYAERVGKAYGSRTYAELAELTADLPVGPLGTLGSPMGNGSDPTWQFSQQGQYPQLEHHRYGQNPAHGQHGLDGQLTPTAPYRSEQPAPPRTSWMAVASLIFGLGAFLTLGLTAPLALVLGGGALIQSTRGQLLGEGLAVGGVILGLLALVVRFRNGFG